MKKIKGMRIEDLDGIRCVVFQTTGGDMAFPARGIEAMLQQLRALSDAKDLEEGRKVVGDWLYLTARSAQTVDVDILPTTAGQRVVLTMDLGQSTERSFSQTPEQALVLAERLRSAAHLADPRPPSQN
jgi:N6-adenosine-specific RNA methylase IME4